MTPADIEKMADRYGERARRALGKYQEIGDTRHYRDYEHYSDLEDALLIAAGAADDHAELIHLRVSLSLIANCAREDEGKPEEVIRELIALAKLEGVLGED